MKTRHTTILLVEPENDVRLLMAVALRRLGYSVIEATTVADACARFGEATRTIALLVSEAVLADGTGTDLHRLLVGIDPRLRLLLISGQRESAGIVLKPFSLDALIEKVRDRLRGRVDIEPAPVRVRTTSGYSVR